MSPREVEDLVVYQIGALAAVAAAQGLRLQHVKPHGALYNMAVTEFALAEAIARATAAVDRSLVMLGLPGSQLLKAGERAGLRDRIRGLCRPRLSRRRDARAADAAWRRHSRWRGVVQRVVGMVRDQAVVAEDGTRVPLRVDTICVHGDTPGAAQLAARVRAAH